MRMLIAFFDDEQGTTLVEYGVISSLISLAALSAMVAMDIEIMGLLAH
jgi:Flp pilus assembly pilin Flp